MRFVITITRIFKSIFHSSSPALRRSVGSALGSLRGEPLLDYPLQIPCLLVRPVNSGSACDYAAIYTRKERWFYLGRFTFIVSVNEARESREMKNKK